MTTKHFLKFANMQHYYYFKGLTKLYLRQLQQPTKQSKLLLSMRILSQIVEKRPPPTLLKQ
jgi:hypothetical protein